MTEASPRAALARAAPLPLAVLVSGSGSNLQAILDACAQGGLAARVCLVLADRPGCLALERAGRAGVPTRLLRPRGGAGRAAFDQAAADACLGAGARLVVLAGFMRLLGPAFLEVWQGRCLNVHPSLLPAFPGLDAPAQALAYGARVAGCTVHFVDAGTDSGPIVLQEAVPVRPEDTAQTLHRRIQALEWRLLPEAIGLFAAGRLSIEGRRVRILEGAETCPGH